MDSVSSNCRLVPAEELLLLDSGKIETSTIKPEYAAKYKAALNYNRQQMLRAQLSVGGNGGIVLCCSPLRDTASNWSYYSDNTVFGLFKFQTIKFSFKLDQLLIHISNLTCIKIK